MLPVPKYDLVAPNWAVISEPYTVLALCHKITIQPGFGYDGASIPDILQPIAGNPWNPIAFPAATVHDWLYASHALPKWLSDLIFWRLLLLGGVPSGKAFAFYLSVARFGGPAYTSHGPEDRQFALAHGSMSLQLT